YLRRNRIRRDGRDLGIERLDLVSERYVESRDIAGRRRPVRVARPADEQAVHAAYGVGADRKIQTRVSRQPLLHDRAARETARFGDADVAVAARPQLAPSGTALLPHAVISIVDRAAQPQRREERNRF